MALDLQKSFCLLGDVLLLNVLVLEYWGELKSWALQLSVVLKILDVSANPGCNMLICLHRMCASNRFPQNIHSQQLVSQPISSLI